MAKKNIKKLLEKYEGKKVEEVKKVKKEEYWNYLEDCGWCTNFDPKTKFCNTYYCFPSETAVSPEEFCTEFVVDKTMEEKYNQRWSMGKKLQM